MEISLLQLAPSDWIRTTLGDIVARGGGSIQTGPFGSQLHASDYVPVGIPSIMPVNIGENRLIREGIACIKESDAHRLSKHLVRKGDIIYSRRGDVERRALVREAEDGWFCGTGCLKLRLGNGVIVPEFAAFYLGHPEVRSWIVRHAVGITMPNLNTSIMEAVPFLLPSLDEQRAIAETLQSLDDKIEQNRRTSRKLEELARGMFKAWFVDFEPVHAKSAGRTSYPGMPAAAFAALPTTFIDSEIGPAPEGWKVGTVADCSALSKEQIDPQEHAHELFDHFSIPAFDSGQSPVTERGETIKSQKTAVAPDSVLFSKLNPRIPRVWLPPQPDDRRQIASTEFLVIVPRPGWSRYFIYCLFQQSDFRDALAQNASGTSNSHQRIRPADLLGRRLAIPTATVAKAFQELVEPQMALCACLQVESRRLAALRDYLLPKLLSGEVRVAAAERAAGRLP